MIHRQLTTEDIIFGDEDYRYPDFATQKQREALCTKGYCQKTGKLLADVAPQYFRPAEVELLWGDSTKAEKELGWKRQVSFPGLVQMMVKADCEKAKK